MSDLETLLGGVLNQDWVDDYPDVWDAVASFRSKANLQTILTAHAQVLALLGRRLSEAQLLDALLDEYGSGYWPPGDNSTATEFLTRLELELRPENSLPARRHAEHSATIAEHQAKVRQADVAEARREPGLKGLLGGYLYFGWNSDYDSVREAVADFVATAGDTDVARAHEEVVALLAKRLDDDHLTDVLNDDLRSGYSPDAEGMTPTHFLTQLELELRPLDTR